MNPTILIIFGITGDLARKKLIPAFFHLHEKGLLPKALQIIGFSRQDIDDTAFRAMLREQLPATADAKVVDTFARLFVYQQGFFDISKGYEELSKRLGMTDKQWRTCANKLFYLAVPPQYYKKIFYNLADSGLTVPCSPEEGWTRVIVEKPFGQDQKTAEELDMLLGKLFKEEQIYRIDHYLGKETVQNILAFRFSNTFFEPSLNKEHVESISIAMTEDIGIGSRGQSYDGVGALRDVGQSHLLQLLALFTMENPGVFDAASIRAKRAELLSTLKLFTPHEVKENTIRGQYESYRKEKDVNPKSITETYFKIKAFLDTPRWAGVPIYLENGKMLTERKAQVAVAFKHQTPCLCPEPAVRHYKNVLRYEIQPREGMFASFWVKRPGNKMVLDEKDFSFNYHDAYPGELSDPHVAAYEKLLLDAIDGNQTLFISTEEIAASWKFTDAIISGWKKIKLPLLNYAPVSDDIRLQRVQSDISDQKEKQLGLVGFGKMGRGMALRLAEEGWRVEVFDPQAPAEELLGITQHQSLEKMVKALKGSLIVWVMIPSTAVEPVLFGAAGLARLLKAGDTIIDGGNSFYKDSARRAKRLQKKRISYLDAGVSGGPSGARNGACIMVGGEEKAYKKIEYLFKDMTTTGSYGYFGKAGVGHFIKMVHNGIEYGIMQAIAEGFSVIKSSSFKPNLRTVARIYNNNSVIESRLIGWLEQAFAEYGDKLGGISGTVAHTGEGEWTVKSAREFGVKAPVIKASLDYRVQSTKHPDYTGQILSALRNQFGGHAVTNAKPKTASKKKK